MSTSNDTKNIKSNLRVVGLSVLGVLIFILHIAVFYVNQYMFNVIVCIYIIVYAIIIFISVLKNKDCYDKSMFNILVNFSLYTIILQIFLLIFTFFMYLKKNNKI